MTLTRWKVMAGALGLSLGGLAAVAEQPAPPSPVIPLIPLPANPVVPAPPVMIPAPLAIPAPPVLELPPLACDGTCPTPTIVAKQAIEVAPMPRAVVAQKAEAPAAMPKFVVEVPYIETVAAAEPVIPAPVPAPITVAPTVTPASPPALIPSPVQPIASAPVAPVVQLATVPVPYPESAPTPVAPVRASTPAASEKKLKVLLNMGESRPRFEVRDGDEMLLKLVSDKVDVKCPVALDDSLPTMKASGAVTFYTPGGEGVCDELTLIPGTPQVIVSGHVRFTYHWGKVETEVAGDRMTFRLGTTPTGTSGPVGVTPVSYSSPR